MTDPVNINYLQPPATIINQALDVLGESGKIIGDVTDGTPVAEVARRNYGQGLRQLLRTAHWDFARKRTRLTLLGDATGQTLSAGVSSYVEPPWGYCYAWPTDSVQGRWLPWNQGSLTPVGSNGVPLTTSGTAALGTPNIPGRYLVASSDQYPIEVGAPGWDQLPDLQRTEGLGPIYRKVILTDCQHAHFVYTRLVTTIEEWDSLFRQAMVMMMALVIAPTAIEDPKLRLAEIQRLEPRLKIAVDDARVANGNEAGSPQTTDFEASFIRGRNSRVWGGGGGIGLGMGGGLGGFYGGWESLSWSGSVY